MRWPVFLLATFAVAAIVFGALRLAGNEYYFFAGYVVLQYVVLATAWNILGGYAAWNLLSTAAAV